MPCQFGDSPMSLDKKNYITGNQKRQALFLNFLNFFIYIYKIPNSTVYREGRQIFHPDKISAHKDIKEPHSWQGLFDVFLYTKDSLQ